MRKEEIAEKAIALAEAERKLYQAERANVKCGTGVSWADLMDAQRATNAAQDAFDDAVYVYAREPTTRRAGKVSDRDLDRYSRIFRLAELAEGYCYMGYVPELPGCKTQGDTLEECEENLREAIEMVVADLEERGKPVPEPRVAEGVIDFRCDGRLCTCRRKLEGAPVEPGFYWFEWQYDPTDPDRLGRYAFEVIAGEGLFIERDDGSQALVGSMTGTWYGPICEPGGEG